MHIKSIKHIIIILKSKNIFVLIIKLKNISKFSISKFILWLLSLKKKEDHILFYFKVLAPNWVVEMS